MSIKNLTDEELNARYIEANDELARRRRLAAIPQEISELAQQGREMGIEESTLAEALINAPDDRAEAEVEVEVGVGVEAEATKGSAI